MSFRFHWALLDGTPVAAEGTQLLVHLLSPAEQGCSCDAHQVARITGGVATVEGVGRLQFLAGIGHLVRL